MSFDPWHATRSSPIGKRICVGRYTVTIILVKNSAFDLN